MRSRESANRPSQATSVRIRCRPGRRNTLASAASQKTYSYGRQRARVARRRVTSVTSGDGATTIDLPAGAGEQALRTQNQEDDHDRVNDEGAELRHVVLAGDVGDADQERG